MKYLAIVAAVVVAGGLLAPGTLWAGELCLGRPSVPFSGHYRLNWEQRESTFSVHGYLVDGGTGERLSTTGTAFRQQGGGVVISLTTVYPNHYTHPQCSDIFTFAPGNFNVAAQEGTCFGSTTGWANLQFTSSWARVPCP